MVAQTIHRSLGAAQPIIGSVRCVLIEVLMNRSEIVFCSRSQDDVIAHFLGRVSRLISAKTSLAD